MKRLPIDLQDRDVSLLRGLVESRVLASNHVTTLYFDGRAESAKKRLQKLKAAGLVAERPRRVYERSLLYLTRKALRIMEQLGHLTEYPQLSLAAMEKRSRVSELTINHEVAVTDVKVAFTQAVSERGDLKLAEFSTWPALYQFKAINPNGFGDFITVKPDGFIRILENDAGDLRQHSFFLELDRSTETLDTLVTRAVCYLEYYRSGDFAVWRGGRRDEYRQHPFRVLGVFKSKERRDNFAMRLLRNHPPIRHQFCLAVFPEVIANSLGSIWIRPAERNGCSLIEPIVNQHFAPTSDPY